MPLPDLFHTAQCLLVPCTHCHVWLAGALQQFALALTISHTLTSRRYAIWSLVRRLLDEPFRSVLTDYPGPWETRLLTEKRLSVWNRRLPGWRVDRHRLPQPDPPHQAVSAALVTSPRRKRPTFIQEADWQVSCLDHWKENLGYAAMSAQSERCTFCERRRFCESLKSVERLLTALQLMRPRYGSCPGHRGRLADKLTRPQEATFCELCWRLSMRTQALSEAVQPVMPDAGIRRLSSRFCEVHNPSDPGSDYWKDRRYHTAFKQALQSLIILPDASEADRRRLAFEQAHASQRSKRKDSSLKDNIQLLLLQGLKQVEIAQQLGISKATVSKTLKTLREVDSQ